MKKLITKLFIIQLLLLLVMLPEKMFACQSWNDHDGTSEKPFVVGWNKEKGYIEMKILIYNDYRLDGNMDRFTMSYSISGSPFVQLFRTDGSARGHGSGDTQTTGCFLLLHKSNESSFITCCNYHNNGESKSFTEMSVNATRYKCPAERCQGNYGYDTWAYVRWYIPKELMGKEISLKIDDAKWYNKGSSDNYPNQTFSVAPVNNISSISITDKGFEENKGKTHLLVSYNIDNFSDADKSSGTDFYRHALYMEGSETPLAVIANGTRTGTFSVPITDQISANLFSKDGLKLYAVNEVNPSGYKNFAFSYQRKSSVKVLHLSKFANTSGGYDTLYVEPNETNVLLKWGCTNVESDDYVKKIGFVIQARYRILSKNTKFSEWENIGTTKNLNEQKFTYVIPDELIGKGEVKFQFRVKRNTDASSKFEWAEEDLSSYLCVTKESVINTDYKKIANLSIKPIADQLKISCGWSLESNGIWDKDCSYKVDVLGTHTDDAPITTSTVKNTELNYISSKLETCRFFKVRVSVMRKGEVMSSYVGKDSILFTEAPTSIVFAATPGQFSDHVHLSWQRLSGAATTYLVRRAKFPIANDDEYVDLYTEKGVSSASKIYGYDDKNVVAGQYYQYQVLAKASCATDEDGVVCSASAIGFSQPSGIVTGRISYGSDQGDSAVEVRIVPIGSTGDRIYNRSLYVPCDTVGCRSMILSNASSNSGQKYPEGFTVQLQVKPNEVNVDNSSVAFRTLFSLQGYQATKNPASYKIAKFYEVGLTNFDSQADAYTMQQRLTNIGDGTEVFSNHLNSILTTAMVSKNKWQDLSFVFDPVDKAATGVYTLKTYIDTTLIDKREVNLAQYWGDYGIIALSIGGEWKMQLHDSLTKVLANTPQYAYYKNNGTVPVGTGNRFISNGQSGVDECSFNSSLDGYVDELRVWDKPLDNNKLTSYFNSFRSGSESNLVGYYRFDEPSTMNEIFDFSMTNEKYNNNGMVVNGSPHHVDSDVPTLYNRAYTDGKGNYRITNIPYSGEGTSYNIIPQLGTHTFEPNVSQAYISADSRVINSVNFTDKSSVTVNGKITFEGTDYPISGCNFYVDGQLLTKAGKILASSEDGTYSIAVPLGKHFIQVKRTRHTFEYEGYYPVTAVDGETYDFTHDMTINFTDVTKVTLVGRVSGGKREADKKMGTGEAKANVGQAQLYFTAGLYHLNTTQKEKRIYAEDSKYITSQAWSERYVTAADAASGSTSSGSGKYGITVLTDSTTGEYSIKVPPVSLHLESVKLLHKEDNPFAENVSKNIILEDCIDMNLADTLKADSIREEYRFPYNYKLLTTYTEKPTLEVTDRNREDKLLGQDEFESKWDGSIITTIAEKDKKTFYVLDYPVFLQGAEYYLKFRAFQRYVNNDNDTPVYDDQPLAKSVVTIKNECGNGAAVYLKDAKVATLTPNTVELDSIGEGIYRFVGGYPNISGDYLRNMNITYKYNDKDYSWNQSPLKAYVFGSLTMGNNFITAGPNVVDLVIRDPGGSGSTACINQGSSYSNKHEWSAFVREGTKFVFAPSVSTEINTIMGSLVASTSTEVTKTKFSAGNTVEQKFNGGYAYSTESKTTWDRKYTTSSGMRFWGSNGDTYIGKSTNIVMGAVKLLEPVKKVPTTESDTLELQVNKIMGYSTQFNTQFVYTQRYIIGTELPRLKELRNSFLKTVEKVDSSYSGPLAYLTTRKATDADFGAKGTYVRLPKEVVGRDTVEVFNNWITGWENAIAKNEEAKVKAIQDSLDNANNYTVSGGSKYDYSYKNEKASSHKDTQTVEVTYTRDNSGEQEILGIGAKSSFSLTVGATGTHSDIFGSSTTTSYGYTLAPGNKEAISVSVITDNLHPTWGPIFYTRAGETMAPYEGEEKTKYYYPGKYTLAESTMAIEKPEISVSPAIVTDVPNGSDCNVELTLTNLSETQQNLPYKLKMVDASNRDGLQCLIDGTALTGDGRIIYIPYGSPVKKTLVLRQSNMDVLDYENIGMNLVSYDDSTYFKSAAVSVHFVPSSSPVTISTENATINCHTDTVLNIKVKDINRQYRGFKYLDIQYKGDGDADWTSVQTYAVNESDVDAQNHVIILPSGMFTYPFSMKSTLLYDRNYQVRARTTSLYGSEKYYVTSEIINVVKDTQKPKPLEKPTPADGILTADKELSITFNEDIDKGAVLDGNVSVTGYLNNHKVDHDVALALNGVPVETNSRLDLRNQDFSIEGWFKYTHEGTLIEHGDKFKVLVNANGTVTVQTEDGSATSQKSLQKNEWHYLELAVNHQLDDRMYSVTLSEGSQGLLAIDNCKNVTSQGILRLGNGLKGAIHELTLWNEGRTSVIANSQKSTAKTKATVGLIGYWPLSKGYGTVGEDEIYNHDFTVPANSWLYNYTNYAAALDGESNHLALNTQFGFDGHTDGSIELWFRNDRKGKASTLLAYPDSCFTIGFNENNQMTLVCGKVNYPIETKIFVDSLWHHLAVNVIRNGNTIFYVDGTQVYQLPSNYVPDLIGHVVIGADRNFVTVAGGNGSYVYSNYMKGAVDEVRFWRATTYSKTLLENMHNHLLGSESGLVAYYPFERTVKDSYGVNKVEFTTEDMHTDTVSVKKANAPQDASSIVKDVNVANIIPAKEYDAVNFGTLVVSDRKIVIPLTEDLTRTENCNIKVTVNHVKDKNGNECNPITWTSYVQKNQLAWLVDAVSLQQEVGEKQPHTIYIANSSAETDNWKITNVPSWLKADVSFGQISPLGYQTILFTVMSSTPIGQYQENVYLIGNNGIAVPLSISLYVSGKKPNWMVDSTAYEKSMSLIGEAMVDSTLCDNGEDIVAAFIDGNCVAKCNPIYSDHLDRYMVSMNILGNDKFNNKRVAFKIWDASNGLIYSNVDVYQTRQALDGIKGEKKDILFVDNAVYGSFESPITLNARSKVEQVIGLKQGWNWMSLNVSNAVMPVNDVFGSIKGNAMDNTSTVKCQDLFAVYDTSTGVLKGSLNNLEIGKMYRVNVNKAASLNYTGSVVDVTATALSLKKGWNWIGFLSQSVMSLETAFSDFIPQVGDVVKAQNSFAMYDGKTWFGTLEYLKPGAGYLYMSKNNNLISFTYPAQLSAVSTSKVARKTVAEDHFTTDWNAYPNTMSVIAQLMDADGNLMTTGEIGAFVNDECRGNAHVDENGMVYLSITGDASSDILNFKVYAGGKEQSLTNVMAFSSDAVYGTFAEPYVFKIGSPTGIEIVKQYVDDGKVHNFYGLHGIHLKTTFAELPAGVYIVDGKKIEKRISYE